MLLMLLISFMSCQERKEFTEIYTNHGLLAVGFEQPYAPTRADASTLAALPAGVRFKVYVYDQSAPVTATTSSLAEGEYRVSADGTRIEAISELKLYAGVYDFYFVSSNSGSAAPGVAGNTSRISGIANGTDFLYASMKNIGVRSTSAGGNTFTLTMSEPFRRMCSNIRVSVKAKAGTHPVTPTSLTVESVTVTGLSGERSFVMGQDALTSPAGYTASSVFAKTDFTVADASDLTVPRTGSPRLVLPTDGSVPLEFDVKLQVNYIEQGTSTEKTGEVFPYRITLSKPLLAGKSYEFAFTLTFFDHYMPGNLQLDVLPFIETPEQNADEVGN